MFTSNFARIKLVPPDLEPVSIAAWTPRWAGKIRRYPALAPKREWLNMPWDRYIRTYKGLLASLDPRAVLKDLGPNPVILCHCAAGYACHRRMAAEFFEAKLGIEVAELGFDRALIHPFDRSPPKGTDRLDCPWEATCDHCNRDVPVILGAKRQTCDHCGRGFKLEW